MRISATLNRRPHDRFRFFNVRRMAIGLRDVFGIARNVNHASYVDRGGLDERLKYLLGAERHIAIHGDSKQGKSWLRSAMLDSNETIVVQCQIDTDPGSLFRQALGQLGVAAELKLTGQTHIEGSLDFTAGGELGNAVVGKMKAEAKAGTKTGQDQEIEAEPVGRTPGDLAWVATTLATSGKRLVVEDFHYVTEENRRAFAFLLKALGDYGVHVIVVGVWPEDHLLTYYNGDLDGRVEDLHLSWDDPELNQVLEQGCRSLHIEMSDGLREAMVCDAYGNVGLLQRLAERVCLAAGVTEERTDQLVLEADRVLVEARDEVSSAMRARYHAFADDFVRGMKRMREGLEVYKHLLRAFTAAKDEELLEGIDSSDLLAQIADTGNGSNIRQSDLTQALDRVDRLQAKIGVRPLVLTYDRDRRRLFLADRSFLFYRRYAPASWPWDRDDTLDEALARAPEGEQLDLERDIPLTETANEDGGEEPGR
jgi:hypothetical protein